MSTAENPYLLAPVNNPRLLRNRRREIAVLLDTLAPEEGDGGHALLIGDDRSGRTSTLRETGRRAEAERRAMVVSLRLVEEDLTRSGLARALLTATVERLVAQQHPVPDWYLAWCDRVHLRDRSPMTARDLLASGLAFAGDSAAVLDPSVLDRDLQALGRLAVERERRAVVVCVDNGDSLLEDVALAEWLIDSLDAAGGWSLLIAAGMPGATHLLEAVSPCLRRLRNVPLIPLFALDQVRACLTAPLDRDAIKRLMPTDDLSLVLDLLRLTAGNPFEIALVARQLWTACRLGEQEHYELTPRVLERVLHELAAYTGADEALVDGARAVSRLAPERMGPALDLVALSRLTTRQVAVARALGVPNDEGSVNDRLLECDLDEEEARVVEELHELEQQGVVALTTDGRRFTVQGGRAVALALKYQARSLLGSDIADKPFEIPFLACVGEPLSADCARRASELVPNATQLAWLSLHAPTDAAAGARLRAALDAQPFAGFDLDVVPHREKLGRMADLLIDRTEKGLVVVHLTLAADGTDLEWLEVWEVPVDVDTHQVNQALSEVLEEWQPLVTAAGVTWRGSHTVVFTRDAARRALLQVEPDAARSAITRLFQEWRAGNRSGGREQAVALAEEAVDAMRAQRSPDWTRGWETSDMLSRLGFLLSLFDDRIDDARTALLQAQEHGAAEGWVTQWNLANLAARGADFIDAKHRLESIGESVAEWTGTAFLVFFVPGRAAKDSLVTFTREAAVPLLALQRAVVESAAGDGEATNMSEALDTCARHHEDDARSVATWVASSLERSAAPPDPIAATEAWAGEDQSA